MNKDWHGYSLPGGRHLERDERYGFIKVMPRPTDEELKDYYQHAYRNPCIPHDPEGRAKLVFSAIPDPGRILDIGCGKGEMLIPFAKKGWRVLGIEPGADDANAARIKGIDVIEEIMSEKLAERVGEFDAVLLVHVLEHLPEPESILRIICRILRPGGVLYCEVPNDFNPLQQVVVDVYGIRPWWIVLPDHLNYFSISSLASFIEHQGFDILTRTTDFPVEMFLLWEDIYIDNPQVGKMMHRKRCKFEEAMQKGGKEGLLQSWYRNLAKMEIGREAIVVARKQDK